MRPQSPYTPAVETAVRDALASLGGWMVRVSNPQPYLHPRKLSPHHQDECMSDFKIVRVRLRRAGIR